MSSCGPLDAQILPGTARVCAVNSLNVNISRCCNNVQTYSCSQYCETSLDVFDFQNCTNTTSFCQGSTLSNSKTLQSGASMIPRFNASKLSVSILLLLFAGLAAGCDFQLDQNYTMLRNSQKVSATISHINIVSVGITVNTSITANNRTVNGSSAADPSFNTFFNALGGRTNREFPALSNLSTVYTIVAPKSDFFLDWTPYAWCVNGTVTNCSTSNGFFDACGPLFVADFDKSAQGIVKSGTIQGILNPVYIG